MSGTFLNVSGLIAELGSPCMERRIAKFGVACQRVVVIDVAIIGYYLITEIIGRDFVGCVYLMQRDSKLLGVAHQGDGIVCALKVVHGSEMLRAAYPQRVEWSRTVNLVYVTRLIAV